MPLSPCMYSAAIELIDDLEKNSNRDDRYMSYLHGLRQFLIAEQRIFSKHQRLFDAQGVEEEIRKLKEAILNQPFIEPKNDVLGK